MKGTNSKPIVKHCTYLFATSGPKKILQNVTMTENAGENTLASVTCFGNKMLRRNCISKEKKAMKDKNGRDKKRCSQKDMSQSQWQIWLCDYGWVREPRQVSDTWLQWERRGPMVGSAVWCPLLIKVPWETACKQHDWVAKDARRGWAGNVHPARR